MASLILSFCPGVSTSVCLCPWHRPVGLVVKVSASGAEVPSSIPACDVGIFSGRVMPVTYKLALQWLPCQAPGVIGSALGLVGPVSVYRDWVKQKVGSATSVSVSQHVQLSEQIRLWDTPACCWDVTQPTNKLCLCLSACFVLRVAHRLLLRRSQLHVWGSPFWVRLLRKWPSF